MELSALKKQLQEHLGDGLVLIIGSGLSCAEGVPGMRELADHLINYLPSRLSSDDIRLWKKIHPHIKADGLEAALLKHAPTPTLEAAIVQSTGDFIAIAEANIISEVFNHKKTLRLTKLIPHLLSPDSGIPIVTTNYDRLAEIACEEAGLGVDTMFCGHFAARLEPQGSSWSFCRNVKLVGKNVRYKFASKVNIFKPHGSLDWYYREGNPVRYAGALPLPRLIITPGLNKFRSGYESPFDKHREKANDAIDKARRFFIIGYGFNDDHLETHLTPRIKSGVKTVILTFTLSQKARNIAINNKNVIAVEFCEEDGTKGARFIIDGAEIFYPSIDYWDLEGFVKGVLSV
ncbi:SIR2-like protein [Enterobacter sp. BIGb0383]|uniref:SIR2 family protein n=1 Tax=unclassified Enterobacter TaxID=2608935 RepID=UPI000F465ABF|nr:MULTISPECIES: SIR2 family protein [unclassified Enterobacter]ROP63083.1 SIR2-like protein [Enterobacter sp. BIGb0383]ROS13244.1 SIR2-like protein [Enterobacter sp. BIGb0359]